MFGAIVPPYVANVIAGSTNPRCVIARTAAGAAQLVGGQGPDALDPYQPATVHAEVPPDPTSRQAHVQGSVMNPQIVILAPLLGLAVGLAAGTYPAVRAMAVMPLAALRR